MIRYLNLGGAPWLIVLRVLEGIGEGTTFPAMNTLLSAWIPKHERSRASAFVYGGAQVSVFYFLLLKISEWSAKLLFKEAN
jgi:MFS family permease